MTSWMPGVAALMGLALASPAAAEPHAPYDGRARSRDYGYTTYAGRVGYDKGYEDGLKRGRNDGDDRDPYDPSRDGKYRDGDHGYKSSYGPRSQYVRAYRAGFEQGYRDGYLPYARNGRNGTARRDGYYGRDGGYYGRDGGYYGRDGHGTSGYAQYPFDAYDVQRDGRHRHEGQSGWCRMDHRYDERGRIYELPR